MPDNGNATTRRGVFTKYQSKIKSVGIVADDRVATCDGRDIILIQTVQKYNILKFL